MGMSAADVEASEAKKAAAEKAKWEGVNTAASGVTDMFTGGMNLGGTAGAGGVGGGTGGYGGMNFQQPFWQQQQPPQ